MFWNRKDTNKQKEEEQAKQIEELYKLLDEEIALNENLNQENNKLKENIRNELTKQENIYKKDYMNIENNLNEAKQNIEILKVQNNQLKEEINKKDKEINDLTEKIKELQSKNDEINNNMINIKNENSKLIDELNKCQKTDEKIKLDKDPLEFYDIIVNINSMTNIKKEGWDVLMSGKGKEICESKIKNKHLVIGVIGNRNKGKSFILQALSGEKLQTGTSISTVGLSIKFSKDKFVLLDCAGSESPLLGEHINMLDISRDKLFTEAFLQNYIIRNCNILLLVIGILSFSEQKLINKISTELKKIYKNKNLLIIHNLQTYETKKQVENYINEFLTKSATFKVERDKSNFSVDKEEVEYFYEIENHSVKHFIYAKENSEAGEYYNKRTIKAILNMHNIETTKTNFDYKRTIAEHFKNMGGLIYDLKADIELNLEEISAEELSHYNNRANLDDGPNKSVKKEINNGSETLEANIYVNKKLIKYKSKLVYKGKENLILQKMVIDELGISSFIKNDFTPDYECYYDDKYLTLTIESPEGVILTAKRKHNKNSDYPFCIEVNGEKKEEKKKDNVRYLKYKTCGKYYSIIPFQDMSSSLGPIEEEEPRNGWKTFKFPIIKNIDE